MSKSIFYCRGCHKKINPNDMYFIFKYKLEHSKEDKKRRYRKDYFCPNCDMTTEQYLSEYFNTYCSWVEITSDYRVYKEWININSIESNEVSI